MDKKGISISTSKWVRLHLNEFSKLGRAEQLSTMKYLDQNMQLLAGVIDDKSKKKVKEYRLKADPELFILSKKIERFLIIDSGAVHQNDTRINNKQVKELVDKLNKHIADVKKLDLMVKSYRRKTLKKLFDLGAITVTKKSK